MGRDADDREQSRWFIKTKTLDEQVKACRKSLEAAERSGRSNIAEALRAKLSKLTGARDVSSAGEVGSGNSSKTSVDSIAPRLKKGKKKLAATQLGADEHGHGVVPLRKRKRKARTSNSERASERNMGSNRATSPPDATVPTSMAGAGTGKVRKVSPASEAQQAAVDLLLKAASKARASRRAMGEESEEEAPLPDLPPPRQGLGEDSGAAPRSDVDFEGEEEEVDIGEEPVEESTCGQNSGARKRQKKLRRKERLERIRQQKTEPHPSWQASKSPIISGAIIAGEQGAHTNFEESECD